MAINGPTINVGNSTRPEDIQKFLEQHKVGKHDKIHGKYDEATQTTTLYIAKRSPSLGALITGKWAERRGAAKAAIDGVVAKSLQRTEDKNHLSKPQRGDLTKNIGEQRAAIQGHSLQAGYLSVLSRALAGAEAYDKVLDKINPDVRAPSDGPSLKMLGSFSKEISQAAQDLHDAIQNNKDVKQAAEAFGNAMAKQFAKLSAGDRELIATSAGQSFKAELLDAFKTAIGGQQGEDLAKTKLAMQFLDIAFGTAASQLLPDRELRGPNDPPLITITYDDGDTQQTVDLPHILVNGNTYKPDRHLGSGGFGDVFAYRATDGSNKEVAYKIANSPDPERLEEGGAEVRAHKALLGSGHPNVIKLEGVIRTPDDRLGIVLESAPLGNGLDAAKKLNAAIGTGPGKISPEQAKLVRLTMLQQATSGLGHIHNPQKPTNTPQGNSQPPTGGVMIDKKTPNLLVGSDGTIKISDFGLAKEGSTVAMLGIVTPDNPRWVAPEVLSGRTDLIDMAKLTHQWVAPQAQNVKRELDDVLPGPKDKAGPVLAKHIMHQYVRDQRELVELTNKADIWSLGVIGIDLWGGGDQLTPKAGGSGGMGYTNISNAIEDFGKVRSNQAIAPRDQAGNLPPGALFESTGDPDVDALLNTLLAPLETDRPDTETLLADDLFKLPGVGSNEAKALLAAILGGNSDAIDKASTDLQMKVLDVEMQNLDFDLEAELLQQRV